MGVLLAAGLVGVGLPAQATYDHFKETFDGQSPVVCVGAGNFRVEQLSFGDHTENNYGGEYRLEILSFVAREDEEVAEDALDNVIEEVFSVLAANRKATRWAELDFSVSSTITAVTVGGDPYWMEILPVTVRSY